MNQHQAYKVIRNKLMGMYKHRHITIYELNQIAQAILTVGNACAELETTPNELMEYTDK